MSKYQHINDILSERNRQRESDGWLTDPLPDTPEVGQQLAQEFIDILWPVVWKTFAWSACVRLAIHFLTGHGPGWENYLGEVFWCMGAFGLWRERVVRRRAGRLFTKEIRHWGAFHSLLPYFLVPYGFIYVPLCILIALCRTFGWAPLGLNPTDTDSTPFTVYSVWGILLMSASQIWSAVGTYGPLPENPEPPTGKRFMDADESMDYSSNTCRDYIRDLGGDR